MKSHAREVEIRGEKKFQVSLTLILLYMHSVSASLASQLFPQLGSQLFPQLSSRHVIKALVLWRNIAEDEVRDE